MNLMKFKNSDNRPIRDRSSKPVRNVFIATWLGWMLDGFDAAIYAYVFVLSLGDLLPASGIAASSANIVYYGGVVFACFMIGWACSMWWGWAADRYGRIPILCATILTYSVFTAASGLATNLVMFAAFRFFTGFGVGGEWSAGTAFLHEQVPEDQRVRLAAWLHSAAPSGMFLAALIVLVAGNMLGWRGLFLIGILPAFLALYIRRSFPADLHSTARPSRRPFLALFEKGRARGTWSAAGMLAACIFGLWSTTFWAPSLVMMKLTSAGATAATAQRTAALTGLMANGGTLVACLFMPAIISALGSRRATATVFLLGSFVSILLAYALAIEMLQSTTLFIALVPLVGFFTNGVFSLFTIWIPEMFPSSLRGSGAGFTFSFGRLSGAVGPFVIGASVAVTGSLPLSISLAALVYLLGLPLIRLSPETAGSPLPA